jgi:hypothetical protein
MLSLPSMRDREIAIAMRIGKIIKPDIAKARLATTYQDRGAI